MLSKFHGIKIQNTKDIFPVIPTPACTLPPEKEKRCILCIQTADVVASQSPSPGELHQLAGSLGTLFGPVEKKRLWFPHPALYYPPWCLYLGPGVGEVAGEVKQGGPVHPSGATAPPICEGGSFPRTSAPAAPAALASAAPV